MLDEKLDLPRPHPRLLWERRRPCVDQPIPRIWGWSSCKDRTMKQWNKPPLTLSSFWSLQQSLNYHRSPTWCSSIRLAYEREQVLSLSLRIQRWACLCRVLFVFENEWQSLASSPRRVSLYNVTNICDTREKTTTAQIRWKWYDARRENAFEEVKTLTTES